MTKVEKQLVDKFGTYNLDDIIEKLENDYDCMQEDDECDRCYRKDRKIYALRELLNFLEGVI